MAHEFPNLPELSRRLFFLRVMRGPVILPGCRLSPPRQTSRSCAKAVVRQWCLELLFDKWPTRSSSRFLVVSLSSCCSPKFLKPSASPTVWEGSRRPTSLLIQPCGRNAAPRQVGVGVKTNLNQLRMSRFSDATSRPAKTPLMTRLFKAILVKLHRGRTSLLGPARRAPALVPNPARVLSVPATVAAAVQARSSSTAEVLPIKKHCHTY